MADNAKFVANGDDGFQVTFDNGWTVSVQFGRFHHAGPGSAEVAVINPDHKLVELEGGDTVLGWQTPAEVLERMQETAARVVQDDLPSGLYDEEGGEFTRREAQQILEEGSE